MVEDFFLEGGGGFNFVLLFGCFIINDNLNYGKIFY